MKKKRNPDKNFFEFWLMVEVYRLVGFYLFTMILWVERMLLTVMESM
jgi:hypothetical protein